MTTAHPTPAMLEKLAAGALHDPAAQRAAARHLLRRCPVCTAYLRGAAARLRAAASQRAPAEPSTVAASPTPPNADPYTGLLARGLARSAGGRAAIAGDAVRTTACWNLLAGNPPAQRLALVRSDPRFHHWGLAARLVETADDAAGSRPAAARHWCRLALEVAARLPAERYPASLVADLRARAAGRLGATLAALGRPGAWRLARAAFDDAWRALEAGSGDPLERAALLCREADLALALGDFPAAAHLLRPAAAAFRLHRRPAEEGAALHQLALAVGFEHPQRGARLARRALALIDPAADPRLDLAARHALIWFLNDGGEELRALHLLGRARPLYRRLGPTGNGAGHPSLPWLEARICLRLGELAAAERGLAAVWHAFRAAGLRQDLALVSLDLAEAYLAQGKRRPALRLLASFHQRLLRWRMHSDGLAAWLLLLREAGAPGGLPPDLTRDAALYFRRAWRRRLPFRR